MFGKKERDSLVKLPPSWAFTEATTPVAGKVRKNVKDIKNFFLSLQHKGGLVSIKVYKHYYK